MTFRPKPKSNGSWIQPGRETMESANIVNSVAFITAANGMRPQIQGVRVDGCAHRGDQPSNGPDAGSPAERQFESQTFGRGRRSARLPRLTPRRPQSGKNSVSSNLIQLGARELT